SRGEYFTARLMAEYLGYEFLDAADCIFFGYDGKFDLEKTYAALSGEPSAKLNETTKHSSNVKTSFANDQRSIVIILVFIIIPPYFY
ncbi:MAG: hypothetical protein IIV21_00110, partial [Bacteroidales bacterium]|nr:hypothetical protein [Bacteroidales bacterium]